MRFKITKLELGENLTWQTKWKFEDEQLPYNVVQLDNTKSTLTVHNDELFLGYVSLSDD